MRAVPSLFMYPTVSDNYVYGQRLATEEILETIFIVLIFVKSSFS